MNGRPGRADLAACLLLGALIGASYAPELLGRRAFFFLDVSSLNLPARDWAFRQIRGGHFPEWCTHWYAGFPFVAESQSGVYYPPNYLFFLALPGWYATTLAYVSHLWLAGVGAYLLFRRNSSVGGAWLGAASFALGGRLLEHQIHAAVAESIAWLPLILLGVLHFIECGSRRALWWSAGAAGVQALAGALQTVVLSHLAVLVFTGAVCGTNRRALARGAAAVTTVGFAAVGLSAALLLPTFELFLQSPRSGGGSSDWANFGALSPLRWVAFLLPGAFGSPAYSTAWLDDREPVFETGLYHGVIVVVLAMVGVTVGGVRRRAAFAGLLMIVVGLSLAAGEMHLLGAGLRRLPVFSAIRVPARYLLLVGLGLCQLAALGWDEVAGGARQARRRLFIAAASLGVGAIAALGWLYGGRWVPLPAQVDAARLSTFLARLWRGALEADAPRLMAGLVGVGCCTALGRFPAARIGVFACLAFDLGWTVRLKYPTIEPGFHARPPTVDALRRHCEPDPPRAWVHWSLNAARGVDLRKDGWQGSMEQYRRFGECLYFERGPLFDVGLFPDQGLLPLQPKHLGEFRSRDFGPDRLFRLLGLSVSMSPLPTGVGEVVYRGVGCVLERIPDPVPYALFTNSVERLPAHRVLDRLTEPSFDPAAGVVLEGEGTSPAGPKQTARAAASWNGPNQLEIELTVPATGVVLVHEMHDRGWQAAVDEVLVPIERANGLFMAIPVGPGDRRVVLTYAPASVRWGRAISGLSLLCWLAVGLRRLGRASEVPLEHPPPRAALVVAGFILLFVLSAVLLRPHWAEAFPTVLDVR